MEHAVKFFKGTLGWTMPRVRYPEQADLWTWLVWPPPAGPKKHRRRPEATLGVAAASHIPDPGAAVKKFRHTLARPGHTGERSETLRQVAETTQR